MASSLSFQSLGLNRPLINRHSTICTIPALFCLAMLATVPLVLQAESMPQSDRTEGRSGIVVTASPLTSELTRLPGSVSVLDDYELTESGSSFFQDQIAEIPNLNWSAGSSRPRFFQIRGVGDLEQFQGAPNSSVAVIYDDVDLTGVAAALSLYDIENIEVHRGPQATRFGSSALAGAINLNPRRSTPYLSGNATSSFGSDRLFGIGAATSGSLVPDRLQARIAVHHHQQDGFRKNRFLNDRATNDRNELTVRGRLDLSASPDTQISLSLLNVELNNGYDAFAIDNSFSTQSDRPGKDKETLRMVALKGVTELAHNLALTSVTSFYRSEHDFSFDGDWGNNPFWAPYDPYDFFSSTDRRRRVFAQQLRLGSTSSQDTSAFNWMTGVYYQRLVEETSISEFSDGLQFAGLDSRYTAHSPALFASVNIPLADKFSLATGGRVEYRDTSYSDSNLSRFSPSDTMLGGHASLHYTPSEESFWYLLTSRGFRGGGFNAGTRVEVDRREYDPESLINLELGGRFAFLERRLETSFSTFVNWRRDQQLRLAIQDDPADPLSFTFLTDNAARGEGIGLEADALYHVLPVLRVKGAAGLLRARVTSADDVLGNLEGRDQSHAPRWQYALGAEYDLSDKITATGGVTGRDRFFFDDSHDQTSSPYHLVNASLLYESGPWQFIVWGKNLTDREYAVRGFFFGNEPPDFPEKKYVQLGDPRSFGVTVRYDF